MTVPFLHRNFIEEKFARSRNYDPIVLISASRRHSTSSPEPWALVGCVVAEGRPRTAAGEIFLRLEANILFCWQETFISCVAICNENNFAARTRCTVLSRRFADAINGTGCCGVHPPKSWSYIRRKDIKVMTQSPGALITAIRLPGRSVG
jgi:hypothetical protein